MKVSVLMPTYNHGLYIAQSIESFLMQNCDFEIELIIGDDASTDNTLAIAEKYATAHPSKIKLIAHNNNGGLLRNYRSIINLAKGEYFAILESDDYWTDKFKLQKQVGFLDSHPSYGLSFTRWERLRDGVFSLRDDSSKVLAKYSDRLFERFLLRNIIQSPTVCFRRCLFERYCQIDDYIKYNFKTFDFPVWLSLIRHSDIHYLDSPTAVYRSLSSSLSNNQDLKKRLDFETSVEQIRRYIISRFGKGDLSMFQIAFRETIIKSRHAFRCKKYMIALTLFMKGFILAIVGNKRQRMTFNPNELDV